METGRLGNGLCRVLCGVSGFKGRVSSWPGRLGAGTQRPHFCEDVPSTGSRADHGVERPAEVVLLTHICKPARPLSPQPTPSC